MVETENKLKLFVSQLNRTNFVGLHGGLTVKKASFLNNEKCFSSKKWLCFWGLRRFRPFMKCVKFLLNLEMWLHWSAWRLKIAFWKLGLLPCVFLGQSSPELVLLEEKQPTNEQNELTLKSESLLLEFGFVRRNQMSCERKLSVFACYYRWWWWWCKCNTKHVESFPKLPKITLGDWKCRY